jgi:hypothetical protein
MNGVGFYWSSFCFRMRCRWRAFCRTILLSFSVAIIRRVAPLGVSVLPLHTSLSACNRNTFRACSTLDEGAGRFPTSTRKFLSVGSFSHASFEDLAMRLPTTISPFIPLINNVGFLARLGNQTSRHLRAGQRRTRSKRYS